MCLLNIILDAICFMFMKRFFERFTLVNYFAYYLCSHVNTPYSKSELGFASGIVYPLHKLYLSISRNFAALHDYTERHY